ncbi:universal stress protein [Streptomyces sp. Ru62]|uniref:universal stress protein n=1 Tax=Streptomyces sp. Ru62 TaxID=2080745 RepID=UPI000CDCE82B|nr:universal stress protein [Streptomyces sp. Ru62]POX63512.1 universal stress protein [Streptomyces sp. Ru62]
MTLPVVVGVDGSESSLCAIDWAVGQAALHRLPLRLVHASLWERYEGPAAFTHSAEAAFEHRLVQEILNHATDRARENHPGVKIAGEIVPEDAQAALLREARRATAVVTGCRGRGPIAGALLGSVSRSLVMRAPCPVVVVRGIPRNPPGDRPIVVGVGDTAGSTVVVRFAFREAEARHCPLHVVRAWHRPAHRPPAHPLLVGSPAHEHEERAAALLDDALRDAEREHPGVPVHCVVAEGPAVDVLLAHAATADLLVLGSPRRHGPLRPPLNGVTQTVLRHTDCPVAVVPPRTTSM